MNPNALASAIDQDRTAGMLPIAVVATVGTTSTTAVDPVPAIAEICAREQLWLHVDAAYAGAAGLLPEMRWALAGCERADSLVVNPHKWLLTPVDCSVLYTRRPEVLRRAFSLVPEYLTTPEPTARNLMDYGVALGRRFRALKLWFVMRTYGAEGLRQLIRSHMAMARGFAEWIDADPEWERLAPTDFSVVVFRHVPRDARNPGQIEALNTELLARINATGEVFLSHTRVRGKYALRLAIGNFHTQTRHVERAWQIAQETAASLALAPTP
jgi:aromatic-L-amino-acid decarboxylase